MRCQTIALVGLAGALFNAWPECGQAQPASAAAATELELAAEAAPQPEAAPLSPEAVRMTERVRAVKRERPVIGLVLSGGGARGGAHIGVLRALEELHIPIDVIAGTSIGAAIGGIYASGLSVEELEDFVHNIDWDAAFLNDTPRRLRSFRRKRDDDLFLVDQRPGLNRGQLELPAGLVQGQVIDMVMARVTLPAWGEQNFDELRVPFRAVAGDLETGDAIVLGSGNLARALRASMTVPAAISPIEIDGHLLVDGGIAMNLPVEIAKRMGADIIIAVDISEPLSKRDELNSVVDVTSQLTSLLTYRGTAIQRELLTGNDVVLMPQFSEDFSSVNFNRLADTIDTGYEVAMAHRDELERLALSPADYARYQNGQLDPQEPELPVVDFLHLENDGPLADSVVEARLRDIEIGLPIDVDAVEKSINRVYGLEVYQNVRYELVEGDDGTTGLALDLEPRSWGPNYLQLGVEYSDASDEDALFGLSLSYLSTAVNDLGGEWRALFSLGDEPGFLADFYQPIGSQALYFVAPNLRIESKQLNLFDADALAAEVKLRTATLELGLGRELLDWAEVRGGLRRSYGDTKLRVGDPALVPYEDFRGGEWFARFSVDTLDNISFPRRGIFSTFEWTGSRASLLAADTDFDQLRLRTAYAKTWGRHTLLTTLRYDATISGTPPIHSLFRFGGFLELSGLNQNQLTGKYVTQLGTSYYRRIGDLALFPAFAGVSVEVGNAWGGRQDISLKNSIWGGSLWAGVDTPVGPVYLGVGTAEGGDQAFYVFLGRLF